MRKIKLYDTKDEVDYLKSFKIAKARAVKEGVIIYINTWGETGFVYLSNKPGTGVSGCYDAAGEFFILI